MTNFRQAGKTWRRRIAVGVFLLLTVGAFPALAPAAQWTYLGLGGHQVNTLETAGSYLFAGADSGLYRKPLTSLDTLWTPMPLDTVSVVSLLALDDSTLLAAVAYYPNEYAELQIYRSSDQGATWSLSPSPSTSPTIRGLEANPTDPDTLYAAGYRPLRSTDLGSTWFQTANLNMGCACILPSPSTPGRVWVGGEDYFHSPALYRSDDGGTTWNAATGPFPSPENSVRCLAIDPTDETRMFAGMEGYLERSVTGGASWHIVYPSPNYYYFSDIAIDPHNHDALVATGFASGGGGGQQPNIVVSSDGGATWVAKEDTTGSPGFSGQDVKLIQDNGATVVLVAGTGVYRVDAAIQVAVGNPAGPTRLRLLPPLVRTGAVVIRYEVGEAGGPVAAAVYDARGRRVRTIPDAAGSAGEHEVVWHGESDVGGTVSSGIYFLRMRAGHTHVSQKLPFVLR